MSYREAHITAKDIVLLPFQDIDDQYDMMETPELCTNLKLSQIEEETPLEGIPFIDEGKKTTPGLSRFSEKNKEWSQFEPKSILPRKSSSTS